MNQTIFSPGDEVTWTTLPRGQYGFYQHIPAVVVRVTAKRVRIAVLHKDGHVHETCVHENSLQSGVAMRSALIVSSIRSKLSGNADAGDSVLTKARSPTMSKTEAILKNRHRQLSHYLDRLRSALGVKITDLSSQSLMELSRDITSLVMEYERSTRTKTPALDELCEEAMAALHGPATTEPPEIRALRELVCAVERDATSISEETVSALQEARVVLRRLSR